MDICWIVLTNGRKEYIQKTLPTWITSYSSKVKNKFIIDDSGDTAYRDWLKDYFPTFKIVPVSNQAAGLDVAMKKVFEVFLSTGCSYSLHLEDDFILHKPFDFSEVVSVLDSHPKLSQMSIMRQPWYSHEIKANGLVESLEKRNKFFESVNTNGYDWVRHQAFYTLNPSIYTKEIASIGWPDGTNTEYRFSQKIFSLGYESGIWGARDSWPHVEHIGFNRTGVKY